MTAMTAHILDPRGLIRSVLLWALLTPLALIAFLGAQLTRYDWVDGVNALVYAFGAILALALAHQAHTAKEMTNQDDAADPFGRTFWMIAAIFCLTFVATELGGDTVDQIDTLPVWIDDCVCLISAAIFVTIVVRLRSHHQIHKARILRPIIFILIVALTIQTVAFGLDISETYLRQYFYFSAETFDNTTDLLQFVFLQLYLLSLIGLATEISARHALQSQISTAEALTDSAACLRAAQVAFTMAAFSSRKFAGHRLQRAILGLLFGGGIGGIGASLYMTHKLSARIQHQTGKSALRQFIEQMHLMWQFGLAPKAYYQFELFDPALAPYAAHYLQRTETKIAAYKVMRRLSGSRSNLSDKLEFHNRCCAFGLPVAPVIFAATAGSPDQQFIDLKQLPAFDLFIKPRKARGGRGAMKLVYTEGIFTAADGQYLSPTTLMQMIIQQSTKTDLLVQKTLSNHPDLADLNCGVLSTIRIVTCRNEAGGYELTNAAFRMSRIPGSAVDNFHAGGIAAAVDIVSGRLGPATDLGLSPHSGWFTTHPITGATIKDRPLPFWQEARDLVERAHAHFSDFAVVGWDIAILDNGPCIVEANGAPDLDIIQRTMRAPLGNARLGKLMAMHVKRNLRHVLVS